MNTLNTRKNHLFRKSVSLIMAMLFILGTFTGCGDKGEETSTTAPATTQAVAPAPDAPSGLYVTGNYNPLTGEGNYSEDLINNRPVFVSVENHYDARPQWGITSADIVWELPAEGDITRMLLMFADASRLPDKIGPTRSARHYFIEIVEGYDAILVHFGGSPQAYSAISQYGTSNLDGMSLGSYFSRDNSRDVAIEHRAYTTQEKIMSAIDNYDVRTTIEDGYKNPFTFYSSTQSLSGGACTQFTVPFSSSTTYTLTYNETDKVYYSSLGSNPFMDDNGTQQNFTNVIVCYVDVSYIAGDSKGRKSLDLSSGEGYCFTNGTYEQISWEKGDYEDTMNFYGANGEELALNVGRTYVALVPSSNQITMAGE